MALAGNLFLERGILITSALWLGVCTIIGTGIGIISLVLYLVDRKKK